MPQSENSKPSDLTRTRPTDLFGFLSEDFARSGMELHEYLEEVKKQVEQFTYDQLNR
jgi:hypothetical protein